MKYLPIVPDGRGPRGPPEATLDVDVTLINTKQVIQDGVALALVQSDNTQRHGAVDVERFPPSHGMHLIDEVTYVRRTILWVGT